MASNGRPVATVICPICGLQFSASAVDAGMTITYALEAWNAQCPSAALQSPGLCAGFLEGFRPFVSAHALHPLVQ